MTDVVNFLKLMAAAAALVFFAGVSQAQAKVSASYVMDQCNQTVAQRAETSFLQDLLSQDKDNKFTRSGVVKISPSVVFVKVINNTETGALLCVIDGARFDAGRWTMGAEWAVVGAALEERLEAAVPASAIETTKTPDPLDMHLYQRQFVDCASNTSWRLGPHYMPDGGYLFPVSIDWRMKGSVISYLVMNPLFGQTRNKLC